MITIKKSFLRELVNFAIDTYPIESCALFLGVIENHIATVDEVIFSENVENSQVSFTIDPEFLYQVYMKAEKENKVLTGIFHSHPTISSPSSVDLKFMQYNPVAWIILGIIDISNVKIEDMKAYQYFQESVKQVKIKILNV